METVNKNEIIRESDLDINNQENYGIFDENFVTTDESNVWLYVDNGNLKQEVNYDILPRQKGKVIDTVLEEFEGYYDRQELQDLDVDTLNERFLGCCDDIEDFLRICKEHHIKTSRDNYREFEIYGSSQGEQVTVIVNSSEAEKCWGNSVDKGVSKESLEQMFYGDPITVRITILGTEFISEQDCTFNEFDKDEFIDEVVKEFEDEFEDVEFLRTQLEELVPSEI